MARSGKVSNSFKIALQRSVILKLYETRTPATLIALGVLLLVLVIALIAGEGLDIAFVVAVQAKTSPDADQVLARFNRVLVVARFLLPSKPVDQETYLKISSNGNNYCRPIF